jgi:16S rRNA pseudouridine516 synthase
MMRLDKYLTECTNTPDISRSEAAGYIKYGLVTVNGEEVRKPETKVSETDEVTLSGKTLVYKRYVYIMMNKPAGFICENRRHDAVFSLVPGHRKNLSVCGRLDKDAEGMLLLSDDGDFVHRIISPKKHLKKRYFVRLAKPITQANIDEFATGLVIDNGDICRPAELEETDSPPDDGAAACAFVTITEGMFHQVKRMFSSVGNEVLYLKRVQTGGLILPDSLKPGETVELTEADIELLFSEQKQ